MVTTFNEKDMISFGRYLVSPERRALFEASQKDNWPTLEERLSQVHHADFENWKESKSKVQKVRAKFKCNPIGVDDHSDSIFVTMDVVLEGSPENKQFSEYIPYGSFSLGIDKKASALDLFEEGSEYYIDIVKAEIKEHEQVSSN